MQLPLPPRKYQMQVTTAGQTIHQFFKPTINHAFAVAAPSSNTYHNLYIFKINLNVKYQGKSSTQEEEIKLLLTVLYQ